MITHEAQAEVFELSAAGIMPSDSWERPDAVISTAKQDAHDGFFLDTPDGEWLPEGRIAREVHLATSAFVGETSLGRQVFLVAPPERSRHGRENHVPLDAHFAYEFALKQEFLRAVQNAEDGHLITHQEAIRQAGGMDPAAALDALEASHRASADARSFWKARSADQGQDVIRDGALAAAQATQVVIPAGIVGIGIALAARGKDEYGRRFRRVGKLMYMTSAGITAGSLVLSACTSVQAPSPQEVVGAIPTPEQFNPTVDQARQAVASWMGMRVPLAEGEFGVFPTQAIFEVDPTDSTGQTLKTLSLLNADGRTTNPDLRYAMGLALIPSEKTGEAVELPFLVQLGKNGEALMLGMFLDPAQSTKDVGVFRVNIAKDGQIRPVTQEVVVTKVEGGVTIQLRDISDPNNIVTYNLVSTLKDFSVPPQQSVVPTQIVGNNWIEKVVAFMTGVGSVQAAEPEIPEELASATPLPSETPPPEPTATPDALREFVQLNISFPDRLQSESNKDGLKTSVVLSEALMENTGITDLNIPQDQLDQIGKYILGVVMWGNRTANPNLSAFAQFPNLDISGDKIVALSESVLKNGNGVDLSFSDGQRMIKGPVSSLQVMLVTTSESDKIFQTIQGGNIQYVEKEFVNTRANSRFRILLMIKNNQLTIVHASNFPGNEMPFSGGARILVDFEAYSSANGRNKTERLVDFGTQLQFINELLVGLAPAHDDYRQAFVNYVAPYPIPGFLCSGTWDRDLAFKNDTYWRGGGGKLFGCDPAAIKLFSPKTP